MWDETIHPSPNFNGAAFEVDEKYIISAYTLLGISLLIHAGIKVYPC